MRDLEEIEIDWGNESLEAVAASLLASYTRTTEHDEPKGKHLNSDWGEDLNLDWGDSSNLATLVDRLVQDPENPIKSFLAKWLLAIFAGTLLLLIGFAIIVTTMKQPSESEQALKIFVSLLAEIENFVIKVFSPLLAFVLGYYFASNKSTKN